MNETDRKSPAAKPGRAKPAAGDWPNPVRSRDELDAALEAGLESGESPYDIQEITERVLKRLEDG